MRDREHLFHPPQNTYFKLGAEQCTDFPTRGNSLLDLVLCSNSCLIKSIQAEPPFCSSDHVSILCHVSQHMRIPQDNTLRPSFRKADYNLINAFLNTIDWDTVYANCISTEDYRSAFKNIMDTTVYNFVPFVNVEQNRNLQKPGFRHRLKRLRDIKQRRLKKILLPTQNTSMPLHSFNQSLLTK